jgi:hypothetical protein
MMLGAALSATAADTKSTKPKKETRSRQAAANITGCVDQKGTTYVLTGAGTMQRGTTLQGRAFSDDNFARYVGHKVKVTGESREGVFHVDKVDKVAETCH